MDKKPIPITEKVSVIAQHDLLGYFERLAKTYTGDKPLVIILAENTIGGAKGTSFVGVKEARIYAEENPEKEVLLCCFISKKYLSDYHKEFSIFYQLPNAYYLDANASKLVLEKECLSESAKVKTTIVKARLLQTINHTLEKNLNDDEDIIMAKLLDLNEEVKMAKRTFSGLRGLSGKKLALAINHLCNVISIPPKTKERFFAVFCEIDVLVNDEVINEKILNMLKDFEKKRYKIYLWTIRDPSIFETTIRDAGINYPLENKLNFSGGTVEYAIDNLSEEEFRAITQISPVHFIRV